MRESGLEIELAARLDVPAFVPAARVAVGPVNHSAERIVFVLPLDGDAIALREGNRAGKGGVCFAADDRGAAGRKAEEKAFVRTRTPLLDAENPGHVAVGDDFDVRTSR